MRILIAFFAMILVSASAQAKPFEYSPEGCQFSITFPEEPYTSRRCDDVDTDKCYNLVSFTKVYDMNATVNFRVICNPVADSIYEQYDERVMKATLKAMTKRSVVDTFNSSYREEDDYKQAGLVGEGMAGQTSTIYIGQLWIGRTSALSVEAEMIGDQNDKADVLFKTILETVSYKLPHYGDDDAEEDEEPEEAPEEDDQAAEDESE